MKLLAFAASSSKKSINKRLVTYACSLMEDAEVEILDLNDYELPLFSVDREEELGQPKLAHDFLAKIASCDGLIISFAEHNGSYSVAYKNLFDWCSRIRKEIFSDKPVVVLSTSPGARGGASVLALATASLPRFSALLKGSLPVPSFYDNFDMQQGVLKDSELNEKLIEVVASLKG
ncbi:MAG: NAD(P)H-dependent oxidoreductase [Candidatus Thiodiazotropha sp.]